MALMVHMAHGLEAKARIQTTRAIQPRTRIARRSPGLNGTSNMTMPAAFTSSANAHGRIVSRLYSRGSVQLSEETTGIMIEQHRRTSLVKSREHRNN